MLTRRQLFMNAAGFAGLGALSPLNKLFGEGDKKKFRVAACDWNLGKSADIDAFALAKEIGLEGLMVNMGAESDQLRLREKAVQQQYLDASLKTGVKISSIAIAELNNVPYKSDPRTEQWVWDSVEVARNLGVPVVLLAFFHKNDLRNDDLGKIEVIHRLRQVAPHAEKNGIIIGIESYLNAEEHLDIMDKVGSPNIKVYYDFRNTADAGYNAAAEFKKLGSDAVCELHMKENGYLLGKGTLDWPEIGRAIRETGYYGDGWMQIEGSIPKGADLVESYKHNLRFLQTVFAP